MYLYLLQKPNDLLFVLVSHNSHYFLFLNFPLSLLLLTVVSQRLFLSLCSPFSSHRNCPATFQVGTSWPASYFEELVDQWNRELWFRSLEIFWYSIFTILFILRASHFGVVWGSVEVNQHISFYWWSCTSLIHTPAACALFKLQQCWSSHFIILWS